MADSIHPLDVGARVFHSGQIWARSLLGGTAVIREVLGPYHDGAYEYVVDACRDFSRQPGDDNPMDRRTQWASYMTVPAPADHAEAHPEPVEGCLRCAHTPRPRRAATLEEMLSRARLEFRDVPTDIVDRHPKEK